jgi:histidinol phosphatase-like enzyme (inositol monophosphatase family)
MRHFGSRAFERKEDSSPVTAADRAVEEFIRAEVGARFPADGVVGEEFGDQTLGADRAWVIDPIDGTKSFIYGVPLFGVLIGLLAGGKPALGVVDFPALETTYWAEVGLGAFRNGDRISVSGSAIGESLVVAGSYSSLRERGRLAGFAKLAQEAYVVRGWGDAYGHCLVADGRAGVMIDPIVEVWDTCAIMPIVTEAGGTFTNFAGEPGHAFGEALSTNGTLLEAALAAFRE